MKNYSQNVASFLEEAFYDKFGMYVDFRAIAGSIIDNMTSLLDVFWESVALYTH